MAKQRSTKIQLTEEQKALAYSQKQIGKVLYAKLKDDPNFALMSIFCTNIGKMLARRAEVLVPEQGNFKDVLLSFENKMWNWEDIDVIALVVKHGYQSPEHRILSLHVPFADGTDRLMSSHLTSGTKEEILQYLRNPEFGPNLMTALDDFNSSLHNHD